MSDFDDTPLPKTISNQKLLELLEHHRSETLEFAKNNAALKRYVRHLQIRIELLEHELRKLKNNH